MPQSMAGLAGMSGGYLPMAQGVEQGYPSPMQGLPGMSGPYGQLAGMAMQPMMQRAFGQMGMVPMGLNHDQNVYDRIQNQRFTNMQMQAMQQAAQADQESFYKTFKGMSAISGTPFGPQQRMAAQNLSSAAVMAAPMMANMMPDFMDQMGGLKGSATVMTKRMMDAGRYRVDPTTGRMGMSAESVGHMGQQLFKDMYSDENMGGMKGITAGQTGALFQELQMRGMVASGASTTGGLGGGDPRTQTMRAVQEMNRSDFLGMRKAGQNAGVDMSKGVNGLNAEDLDKLNLDPGVSSKLRSMDSDRVKRSLKSYVGAVSAMRDIFGDMGRPNAPMQELLAGLEALTGGSMAQIDPSRLGQMARQTYNLSRQTGMSLDNALTLQSHAQSRAQAMGMEPIHGVQAAQGALGFGGAYKAQGHGAHTAWGAFNADQVQQMDANLRVQAAGSNMANRLATAVRLSEQIGGFQKDSDAARYVDAVRAGANDWRDASGKVRNINMSQGDFMGMMTGAKNAQGQSAQISQGDVFAMQNQRLENREIIQRYNLGSVARREQGQELNTFVAGRMQETVFSRMKAQGVSERDARAAATAISTRSTERMMQLSTEEFADPQMRTKAIANIMQEELDASGHGDLLKKMSPEQREQFMKQTADRFYGSANRAIQSSVYRGFGNLQNVHRLNNQSTLNEGDRQQMQARFTAEMQESMAPLGKGTMLSRAVDALQHAKPGDPDSFKKVVAQALGGVSTDDINHAMMPQLQKLMDQRKKVEDLQDKLSRETDSGAKAKMTEQLNVAHRELRAQSKEIAKIGEQFGMFDTEGLSAEDTRRGASTTAGLRRAQQDIAGLTGGFGGEVTGDQIKEARGLFHGKAVSQTEAQAVLLARRQKDVDKLREYVQADQEVKALESMGGKADQTALGKAKARRDSAKPSGEQEQALASAVGMVKSQPGYGALNDEQARVLAVNMLQSNVANLSPQAISKQMKGLDFRDDDEVRALIRTQRRMTAGRASDEEVQKYMKDNKVDEQVARDTINANLRAKRLGISEADIDAADPANKGKTRTSEQRQSAIEKAMEVKTQKQYVVTDEDRKKFMDANKDQPDVTAEQITKFQEQNAELKGKSPAEVKQAMTDKLILQGRQRASGARFGQFWGSTEGQAFREQSEQAQGDVENIQGRLIATPQMVQRFGARAVEYSDTLRTSQERLRELAMYHTGGDMSRLMAGDFNIDTTSKKGQESATRVRAEVQMLQKQQQEIIGKVRETESKQGRQFELGTEAEARKKLGWSADRKVETDEDKKKLMEAREGTGNEREARRLLTLGDKAEKDMSDDEKKKLKQMTYDVGVARHLKPEDDSAIARLERSEGAIGRMAESKGLKQEDLEKAVAGDKKYLLTADQKARLDEAKKEYKSSASAEAALGTRAANIRRQLSELGDDLSDDGKNKRRKALQDQLSGVEGDLKKAGDRRLTAEKSIEGDAKARGVSTGDYLKGKGYLDEGSVEGARRGLKERDEAKGAVDKVAKDAGLKPEDLRGATGVTGRLADLQKEAVRRQNMKPEDITKALLKEYDFGGEEGGELSAAGKQIAGMMTTPRGRELGQRLLESNKALRGQAEKGFTDGTKGLEAIDKMSKSYFDAQKGGSGDMEKFQKQFGFDMSGGKLTEKGQKQFMEFERNIQLQQQTGFLSAGGRRTDGRTRNSEADLVGMYGDAVRGGSLDYRGQNPGASGPSRMEMHGKVAVDLQGKMMDMAGAWGGGRGYGTPGGT